MPKRSTIQELPADLKAWLDKELIKRGFSGYEELAAIIRQQGHKTSKSSLNRYGQRLEATEHAVAASIEAAKAIVEVSDDREGAMNQALLGLIQEKLFSSLVDMEEAMSTGDLNKVALAVSRLARADVNQKRFADETRSKTKKAADAVKKIAREGGLNQDQQDECYNMILGIVA